MGEHNPGLLRPDQVDALVEGIHQHSHDESRKASGWAASNVDVYQVNCTYYDALGEDDRAYLLARAIQFFTPGIPQVYYVGLFAGEDDMELLARSGVGRDINRHYYSRQEILDRLGRPVVAALLDLIRFRNAHPAFDGACTVGGAGSQVVLTWENGAHRAVLEADLASASARIEATADDGATRVCTDLLAEAGALLG